MKNKFSSSDAIEPKTPQVLPNPVLKAAGEASLADLTGQLRAWRGDGAQSEPAVGAQMNAQIYAALKQLAGAHAADRGGINPTALVHEAVVRLLDASAPWQSRSHFYALAALHMRAILVDHARARSRRKSAAAPRCKCALIPRCKCALIPRRRAN